METFGWAIMPVFGDTQQLTEAALADLLAQTIPTRILVINQGVDDPFRKRLEQLAEAYPEQILLWSHNPPLPSLAASWNRGLQFCWACGAEEALVVNNDVRVHVRTYEYLRAVRDEALFISAVGVTKEQYEGWDQFVGRDRGGPDFSCFLLSKAGHEKYPFDEGFIPAYGEDCSCHREYMLGGDGDKIFSINLPFHHVGGGSGTLKSMSPTARAAHERRIGQSREYYARKWGGPVNQERYTIPFDPASAQDGVTNPDLQRAILQPA